MIRSGILITLSFFLFSFIISDPLPDLVKLKKTYDGSKQMSYSLEYKVFENHYTTVPLESETGFYIKSGRNEYSELMGITSVKLDKEQIVINAYARTIFVTDRNIKRDSSIINLDSLVSGKQLSSGVTKKVLNNHQSCITISVPDGDSPYEKIALYYNPAGFTIDKLEIYYRNKVDLDDTDSKTLQSKPRVEIKFISMSEELKKQKDRDAFNRSRYLNSTGKGLVAGGGYKEFKIVNRKKTGK